MKNKILLVGILAIILAITGNAYAVGQDSNSGVGAGNQVQQQTQNANQGEDNQIQVQTQQQLQNGSETGNQVQNQNQIQNQDEEAVEAVERKSSVANAVQEMLQVADRNGGIGQQVKVIAQTQTQNQEKLETSLQKIQNRSVFAKFFVGPNYGEINNAKKLLEQNREQTQQLNQIKNQLISWGDQQQLTEQIQTLEQANLEIENSLGVAQEGFSLFGWIFKVFSR